MKKKLVIILFVIFFSNIPPFKSILSVYLNDGWYRYSNADGSYTFIDNPISNSNYSLKKIIPVTCRVHNSSDTIMYRLFYKNPLKFWNWGEYFYSKKYNLEYMNWGRIKKKRGYTIENSNNCQQF